MNLKTTNETKQSIYPNNHTMVACNCNHRIKQIMEPQTMKDGYIIVTPDVPNIDTSKWIEAIIGIKNY